MATTKMKHRRTSKGVHVSLRGLSDRVATIENGVIRTDLPVYKAGDTVRVHVRIKEGEKERIQIYEGIVIGKSNRGSGRSFRVRKISHGVGVERMFLESSPKIAKMEVAQEGKVRRAKLYYLRGLEGKAARVERDMEGASLKSGAKSAAKAAKAAAAKVPKSSS